MMMAGSVFSGRCALCLDDGAGGGSDSCHAGAYMCCHKRSWREVLGIQWPGPGCTSCCIVVFLKISVVLSFARMVLCGCYF
jgi:hypothetical protein